MNTAAPSHRPAGLITYDGLPISSGGAHTIRSRDRSAVWRAVESFLRTFTTYREPDDVQLLLYESAGVDPEFFARALRTTSAAFGSGRRRLLVSGARVEYENAWTVGAAGIGDALRLLDGQEPFPEHWLGGPLVLRIAARFELRDPGTGEILANQGVDLYRGQEADQSLVLGESSIRLFLGGVTKCGLFLSLPFTDVTPGVIAYATQLSARLPFRLSPKHWARWQLNRAGTRYHSRRVKVLAG